MWISTKNKNLELSYRQPKDRPSKSLIGCLKDRAWVPLLRLQTPSISGQPTVMKELGYGFSFTASNGLNFASRSFCGSLDALY
jgi:hypothetical protein